MSASERKKQIRRHTDLEVYQRAFAAAMKLFELSKKFAPEERYSLTDQGRRSSRSVCSNLAEAWRKRRYQAAFVGKLSDFEGEARRRRSGFSLPSSAVISTVAKRDGSTLITTTFSECSSASSTTRHRGS